VLVCCTGEGEETEEGYTNGYTDTDVTDDNMADDEESWEQVGPKKKSVFTRKVLFFFCIMTFISIINHFKKTPV